jgi:glycosyltransferase involved in cell wall biosynthesis
MSHELKLQSYREALSLAEAGQYDKAMGLIREHLRSQPDDGEALNDAGTILFCMGRGAEAIEYLEKARRHSQGNLLAQVLWNLCEAYIQEGRPAEAYGLFDAMDELGVLNVDVLNRTANVFLSRDALGGAVECLLRSLKGASQQDILRPMVDIIRGRRCGVAAAGDEDDEVLRRICAYLEPRFRTQRVVGDYHTISLTDAGIIITVGAGPTLQHVAAAKGTKKIFAVLRSRDVYTRDIESINWSGVDSILLCGTLAQMEVLSERVPSAGKQIPVQLVTEPFAVEEFTFTPRGRGKKLAAIGPFDAFNNPAFLLQCMQKLHYLDADYRLYLAGEFHDLATEQYCRWMTAKLNLEGVVFFDGSVRNIEGWLRDKQYIVSSATGPEGIGGLWTAIACGLTPVVHSFAGAQEWLSQSCLFDIAEDFCRLVRNNDPAAENHRDWLSQKIRDNGFYSQLTTALLKLERRIHLATTSHQAVPPKVTTPAAFVPNADASSRPVSPAVPSYPAPISPTIPAPSPFPVQKKTVNELAAEALKASQRFREIISTSDSREQAVSSREDGFSVPFAR